MVRGKHRPWRERERERERGKKEREKKVHHWIYCVSF
jgi:hypothetical protein